MATSTSTNTPNPVHSTAPTIIQWINTIELGYMTAEGIQKNNFNSNNNSNKNNNDNENDNKKNNKKKNKKVCFACQTLPTEENQIKLSSCSKCRMAAYCKRECQVQDWKASHKFACASYQRLGKLQSLQEKQQQLQEQQTDNDNGESDNYNSEENNNNNNNNNNAVKLQQEIETIQAEMKRDIFQRVRMYACPFAVFKSTTLGKGFLFIQTDSTLADLSLTIPKSSEDGRPLNHPRAVLMHYLTLGEYDAEVCRDDFEMAMVRSDLQKAMDEIYDEETQIVILMRFRCGHVSVGVSNLVPLNYTLCRRLGKDYFQDSDPPALQLNIDDV